MPNVNNLDINAQAYTLINAIHEQVTGKTQIAPTSTAEFVSVAGKLLSAGYDPLLNAISQVITNTLFAVRGYDSKFSGLEIDAMRWGNITRKINFGDDVAVEEESYALVDGQSYDHQVVRKPKVLETQFVGADVMSDYWTIFDTQLDVAFHDESEFMRFMSALMLHIENKHTQWKENIGRTALCNFIGAKNVADSGNVIHVLTEYNQETGQSLTDITVMQPANFKPFIEWLNARIETITDFMAERSQKFHVNIAGFDINRHSPLEDLKVYMLSEFMNKINSIVLPSEYHDTYLTLSDKKGVAYWQAIDNPDEIQVTPSYVDSADGSVKTGTAQTLTNIIGVIFDRDAVAIQFPKEVILPAPKNARGQYTTFWYHLYYRMLNDLTENAVVLALD